MAHVMHCFYLVSNMGNKKSKEEGSRVEKAIKMFLGFLVTFIVGKRTYKVLQGDEDES